MVTATLLDTVRILSISDKLALIEAVTQMLQRELQSKSYVNGDAKKSTKASELSSVKPKSRTIQELLTEAANRPKPTPDQMIRLGMFQGRIPTDEELFKAAEWHPTDKELASA